MLSRLYVIINQLHFRHLPHPLSCYNPKSPGTPRLLLAPKFFTTSERAKLCPASRGVPHPRACQPWPAGRPPQPARAPGRLRSLGHSAVLTPSAPEETQMRALSSDKLTTKREKHKRNIPTRVLFLPQRPHEKEGARQDGGLGSLCVRCWLNRVTLGCADVTSTKHQGFPGPGL